MKYYKPGQLIPPTLFFKFAKSKKPRDRYACPEMGCSISFTTKSERDAHHQHDYHCKECGFGYMASMGLQYSGCVACYVESEQGAPKNARGVV